MKKYQKCLPSTFGYLLLNIELHRIKSGFWKTLKEVTTFYTVVTLLIFIDNNLVRYTKILLNLYNPIGYILE